MKKHQPVLPTNEELEEYLFLSERIKLLEKRLDEIKKACKECGSFHTDKYVVAVVDQERRGLVGLAQAEKALGLDLLLKHNLINVSVFQVVKVAVQSGIK